MWGFHFLAIGSQLSIAGFMKVFHLVNTISVLYDVNRRSPKVSDAELIFFIKGLNWLNPP